MPKPFHLMVLTPEREFYSGEAVYVSVQSIAGSIGVLADHVPMVSALDVGALIIQPDEHTTRTAFHSEGFIEVRPECVYILSQACEWPEEIDEKRALEAEQRAQERQHRADVLRAMRELLLQHGFKPAELIGARPAKSTGKSGGGRTQVAPLYRDPTSGATWSGRGTEPAWIKGRDRQAFKVAG